MAIGFKPTVDFAFKQVFGSLDHSKETIHFINSLVFDGSRIREVVIQNALLSKDPVPGIGARARRRVNVA